MVLLEKFCWKEETLGNHFAQEVKSLKINVQLMAEEYKVMYTNHHAYSTAR